MLGRWEVVKVRRAVRVKLEAAICEAFHMGVLIAAGVAMKEGIRLKGTTKIYLFFLQLAILISSGSPLEARALRRATVRHAVKVALTCHVSPDGGG